MCVDIRTYTRVIVRKDGEYLVGREMLSRKLKWSTSPWDAWWTRDMEDAREIALKTGGITVLFNPVVGETKVI